jgi:glycerol-3-phosphate O-acyltransferase
MLGSRHETDGEALTVANRPLKEAENRLARFNGERASLCAEVERRVMDRRLALAARGGDHSLEYVLNDAAYHEIRRLESGPASQDEKKRLPEWRALAHKLRTIDEAEKRRLSAALVHDYAEDIAGRFDERVYRFAKGIMPAVVGGVLAPARLRDGLAAVRDLADRVVVDGPLTHLRTCADRGTLVVTPTHSSNMDSVVIGWAFDQAGLPPVTYGAGKNLFSNRFLSFFMHNLGAYRVDRRLRHEIYKDVLKEYSTVLLERGYHSLFFPGGTRSRSGALERRVKLGLLGTTLTAYQNHLRAGMPQRRLYVVPATINYGIVLEAETLIDDYLAEEGKHRYIIEDDEFSSLSRLYDFSKHILSRPGALHIRFGEPIDLVGNATDAAGESIDPQGRRLDPASYFQSLSAAPGLRDDHQRDAEYTRELGEELTRHYRRLVVLYPTQIVARVLMDRIAAQQGTRDVYRLLRLHSGLGMPHAQIVADVAAWRTHLARHPEWGEISPRAQALSDEAFVADALDSYAVYHKRPAARREGDEVIVDHLALAFYYRNRTAHIPAVQA